MSKSGAPMFCPTCDDYVFPLCHPDDVGERRACCPHCQGALVPSIFNPSFMIGPALGLKLLAVVARIIIRSGALDKLHELAKESETPLDDFALRVAAALLKEAVNL